MLFMQGNKIQVWGRQTSRAQHQQMMKEPQQQPTWGRGTPMYPAKYFSSFVLLYLVHFIKKLKIK
jgi:hypothetical protein